MIKHLAWRLAPAPYPYSGEVRECTRCRRHQPLDHFRRDRTKRHGRDTWCARCCDDWRGGAR